MAAAVAPKLWGTSDIVNVLGGPGSQYPDLTALGRLEFVRAGDRRLKETTATVLGFLITPIIPGLAALALGLESPVIAADPDPIAVLGLLPIGYFFSAVAIAVFGVPLFLLGRHLKLIRWWSAIVAGLAVGIVVDIALELERFDYLFYRQAMSGDDRSLLFFGITGAISGFVFWLIWRQGQKRNHQPF